VAPHTGHSSQLFAGAHYGNAHSFSSDVGGLVVELMIRLRVMKLGEETAQACVNAIYRQLFERKVLYNLAVVIQLKGF
jgi:hypothetical protein